MASVNHPCYKMRSWWLPILNVKNIFSSTLFKEFFFLSLSLRHSSFHLFGLIIQLCWLWTRKSLIPIDWLLQLFWWLQRASELSDDFPLNENICSLVCCASKLQQSLRQTDGSDWSRVKCTYRKWIYCRRKHLQQSFMATL